MAKKIEEPKYEIMGKTTTIHASVKITPKINNIFYSFEYGEERSVPENCDLEKEKEAIFNDCYTMVYNQTQEAMQNN